MAEPLSPSLLSGVASFKNEWSALLECASPAHNRQRLAGLLQSVDWARLFVLAEEHGVVGHLAAGVRGFEENLVPPEIRQALVDRQRAQIFFSLRLTAELFCILDRFTSAGIGALVVKGPALAVQAYGDPAMRSYGDLDLLVRQRDIRRATELMSAAGFTPAVPLSAIDAGKIPGQYLFSKPDSRLIVELHNDCTLRYFPRRLPLEKFFARQIRVRLDAQEAPALAVEDELVLICIHGAKHLWERLMWIADVAALVSRQAGIDWERVADSAQAVGAERMLHTGLRPGKCSSTGASGCSSCATRGTNLQVAACLRLCAPRPLRARPFSHAHARRSDCCSCVSVAALPFSYGRRLGGRRAREGPLVSRSRTPAVSLGAKTQPRWQSLNDSQ